MYTRVKVEVIHKLPSESVDVKYWVHYVELAWSTSLPFRIVWLGKFRGMTKCHLLFLRNTTDGLLFAEHDNYLQYWYLLDLWKINVFDSLSALGAGSWEGLNGNSFYIGNIYIGLKIYAFTRRKMQVCTSSVFLSSNLVHTLCYIEQILLFFTIYAYIHIYNYTNV